jgi:glycerol-3-phosphate dehydrogenase
VNLRQSNLRKLGKHRFDVLIVGAGINGAVSAAALAGRGLRVGLIDRGDFASGVSSESSNLAWGGIKYLESHEYLLVNQLCLSRNELMRAYPSTVKEIRFLTAIQRGFRFWPFFVYLGSIIYWLLGRCVTRPPRYLSAETIESTEPEIDTTDVAGGLEYSDCYLYDNDARFVFNFIRKGLDYGCVAANYVESVSSSYGGDHWTVQARDLISGEQLTIEASVLVNACGPWVDAHNRMAGIDTEHHHVFSKGIHLIVDRVTDNRRVLTFFASDGRLFFLIPMGPKTCIGTTDTPVTSPEVAVTREDRDFVLRNVNAMLDLEVTVDDIVSTRVGVRPLACKKGETVADWVQLSRKHIIEVDQGHRHLSIFGGKLTDCLNVGNEVAEYIRHLGLSFPKPNHRWYGEPSAQSRSEFMLQAELMDLDKLTHASSSEPLSERFWRRYGESAFGLLERIRADESCAELLIENAEYTRGEIELAGRREMVVKLEDFMRRRSKIDLVVRREDIARAPGLREACEILFGDDADQQLEEYLQGLTQMPLT